MMKLNAYTAALDDIHAPEISVERAVREANKRAAGRASAQIKTRYAAAAASLVLASAAGGAMFFIMGGVKPPEPAAPPVSATQTASQSPTAGETESPTKMTENKAETEKPTQKATEKPSDTAAPETEAAATQPVTEAKPQSGTQSPSPATTPSTAPTSAPATAPTDPAEEPELPPEPDIDTSLLCEDGRLYFTVAPTGMNSIDDDAAFGDDHLYSITTKFGTYVVNPLPKTREEFSSPQFRTITIGGGKLNRGEGCYYFYNSDGTILYSWNI